MEKAASGIRSRRGYCFTDRRVSRSAFLFALSRPAVEKERQNLKIHLDPFSTAVSCLGGQSTLIPKKVFCPQNGTAVLNGLRVCVDIWSHLYIQHIHVV